MAAMQANPGFPPEQVEEYPRPPRIVEFVDTSQLISEGAREDDDLIPFRQRLARAKNARFIGVVLQSLDQGVLNGARTVDPKRDKSRDAARAVDRMPVENVGIEAYKKISGKQWLERALEAATTTFIPLDHRHEGQKTLSA
ncbi:MAG: hypothetical protein WCO04_12510 [Pseudomonadota bacterium]